VGEAFIVGRPGGARRPVLGLARLPQIGHLVFGHCEGAVGDLGAGTNLQRRLTTLGRDRSAGDTGGEEVILGALGLVFRTEFRRRWRSWLILVALIAVVSGLVLAAVAAGRRTATAFPRFVAAHGYDFLILNFQPLPELAKLPEVASVDTAN
jgi:hypothetical protein